jgi:signal transduction histidine kinase
MPLTNEIDELEALLNRACQEQPAVLAGSKAKFDNLRRAMQMLLKRQAELAALYEITSELASSVDRSELLQLILSRAIELVQAERGFIVLTDSSPAGFQVAAARQFTDDSESSEAQISRSLIHKVLASRTSLITTNAQEDPRFQASSSIVSYRIRSVMAVPLIYEREVMGAIYVDTRISARLFTQEDLKLLSAMASQAASAIRMARLYANLQTRNRQLQDALAELRATQDELIRSERLSAVGRLASAIIHDFETPMTVIKVHSTFLGQDELSRDERKRSAAAVLNALDGMVEMSQEILDYVRGGGELHMETVNVDAFIAEALDFLSEELAEQRIKVVTDLAYTGPVTIDKTKMRRVVINIAGSARDSIGNRGGTLKIASRLEPNAVKLIFTDDGPGVPAEVLPHIFEPFETYGKTQGTGLGLAISKKIIEDHGGSISAASEPGKGTTFTIRLMTRVG